MRLDVGIGEWKVSRNPEDVLKTYALGSCVAVITYDQQRKVAGMIHIALPESKVNADKATRLPGYFADTGLPKLIQDMEKNGALKRNIRVKVTGGASIMDENRNFDIGRRNAIAVKRFLWKNGLGVIREDTGGNKSRTVAVAVADGIVTVTNSGNSWTL
jgi:chemotaxis protein CheD